MVEIINNINNISLYFDYAGCHRVEASPSHCVLSQEPHVFESVFPLKPVNSLRLIDSSLLWLCRCGPFLWQHWGHDRVPTVPRAEVLLAVHHAVHLWSEIPARASHLFIHLLGSLLKRLFPLMFPFVFIIFQPFSAHHHSLSLPLPVPSSPGLSSLTYFPHG